MKNSKVVSVLTVGLVFICSFQSVATSDPCKTSLSKVSYGNIDFEIPELAKTGFHLHPEQVMIPDSLLHNRQIQAMTDVWNFNHLMEAHQPILIGQVQDPDAFQAAGVPSVLDMPIKFPGTGYAIPDNLRQFAPALQKIIDFEHVANPRALRDYFAYLTIHQSWVEPGRSQRRPGLHVDGFQGIERPQKEPIEHSYLIFSDVPTVFTRQRFQFWNFDFSRYNIFADFDRQAEPELEYPAQPFGIYLADAYTVHRAAISARRVLRTFFRLTYSVAIFDRLGLTDNPLFPYKWDRKEKNLQGRLERYVPPTGMEKLSDLVSLSAVPGRRVAVIGIGEGSDGIQAAQIAAMVRGVGKDVAFVSSFRKAAPHLGGELVSRQVVKVDSSFRMQSREFESAFAKDFPTYIHFDDGLINLADGLQLLVSQYEVDGLILVDGGGNVLAPLHLQEHALNDHRTMIAADAIPGVAKTLIIVCPGINTPPTAHQVMADLDGKRYRPTALERTEILERYQSWGMPFGNPRTFAFIPMIWQQALRGDFGPQRFPTLYPDDPPYIVTPENQDLMVLPFEQAMRLIRSEL